MASNVSTITVPPIPPNAELVTQVALTQALYAQYRNATAFSGTNDPTTIWHAMSRNDPNAMIFYRELEDKDDDVSGALDELKLSVVERNWDLKPGDSSQAALKAKDEMLEQLNRIDIDSFSDALLDAAPYGFWVGEIMMDSSMGQARLLSVEDCPQELFLFGDRFKPQTGPLQLLESPYSSNGTLVPEEKFLIFTYRGRSRSRMGRPQLKSCFWLSWFKRQSLGMWLKCAEKNRGTAISRYADSASEEERQFAIECADAIANSSAIAVPESFKLELELLKSGNTEKSDVYEKLYDKCQYSIARVIKGETLTSFGSEGGKGGTQRGGKTHSETFEKRSVSLAKKAARIINLQLIQRLHLWNYGPDVPAPVFGWDVEEIKDMAAVGANIRTAQGVGIPVPQRWAMQQLGIPACPKDDVVLVPNTAIAPVAPPPSVFSERADAQRLVDANYSALDSLTAQMRADSLNLFATRTAEIVSGLERGVVKE
jgi:phage gp29-like protein